MKPTDTQNRAPVLSFAIDNKREHLRAAHDYHDLGRHTQQELDELHDDDHARYPEGGAVVHRHTRTPETTPGPQPARGYTPDRDQLAYFAGVCDNKFTPTDADYFVRAVNAYPSLLEALQDLVEPVASELPWTAEERTARWTLAMDRARELLAQIQGEQPR